MQQIPIHKVHERKPFLICRPIKVNKGDIEIAHRHEYYQLIILDTCKGTHEIDFEEYPAGDRTVFFISKGSVHKVNFSMGTKGYVLIFPEYLFRSGYEKGLLSKLRFFDLGISPLWKASEEEFLKIHQWIHMIQGSLEKNSLILSASILYSFLLWIQETAVLASRTDKKSICVEFDSLLKKKGLEWNSVEDFALALNTSVYQMNKTCESCYGKSALKKIHEYRMIEAKRRLVYTDLSNKEIAFECGFNDISYFNRFFKKKEGVTPLQFRKNLKKSYKTNR